MRYLIDLSMGKELVFSLCIVGILALEYLFSSETVHGDAPSTDSPKRHPNMQWFTVLTKWFDVFATKNSFGDSGRI